MFPSTKATDRAGSPGIDVWHGDPQRFGHLGKVQPWVNVLGRMWSPDSTIYTGAFQCNDGPFTPLVLGPSAYRLRSPGDFNAEIPVEQLRVGANVVKLWASDEAGRTTLREVSLEYGGSESWPLPYRTCWDDPGGVQSVAQVIDGRWECVSGGVRPVTMAYDRLVAIGDMTWNNYEVTVPITIHGYEEMPAIFSWPSYGPAIGLLIGWQGHSDWKDMVPKRGYYPFGTIAIHRWKKEGPMRKELWAGVRSDLIAVEDPATARNPELECRYHYKVRSQAQAGQRNYYGFKVWPAHEKEPETWDLEGEGAEGGLNEGGILLLAHHTDATFGEVVVSPL